MRRSAIFGATVWLALAILAELNQISFSLIEVLFLLAPLVVVPLGLDLIPKLTPRTAHPSALGFARKLQPFGACAAVLSFFVPTGSRGAGAALLWLFVCALLGLAGATKLFRREVANLPEACVAAGMMYLPVGGAGLVLSRFGATPLGFTEPIVLLTAVHFHYTAFAAPLLASALGTAIQDGSPFARAVYRTSAIGLIAAIPLLALGFVFFVPLLKVFCVLTLALSLILHSLLTLHVLRRVHRLATRILLVISAGSILAGMVLAVLYGVGEFTGRSLVGLAEMARWHGVVNALGFTLGGTLAWVLVLARRKPQQAPV